MAVFFLSFCTVLYIEFIFFNIQHNLVRAQKLFVIVVVAAGCCYVVCCIFVSFYHETRTIFNSVLRHDTFSTLSVYSIYVVRCCCVLFLFSIYSCILCVCVFVLFFLSFIFSSCNENTFLTHTHTEISVQIIKAGVLLTLFFILFLFLLLILYFISICCVDSNFLCFLYIGENL